MITEDLCYNIKGRGNNTGIIIYEREEIWLMRSKITVLQR